ncbi:trypsin [Folsomia candida]|uniref:trypsin n=1 Tax=Folsomia candida TaxID=158441 RepID=UPI0016054517|nr:trypsin [Folsomia candida]
MKLFQRLLPIIIALVINLKNVTGHLANTTIKDVEKENDFRIVGGRPAIIGEFPYQVSINGYRTFIGAGSLISDRHVLTTASMINRNPASQLTVRAGSLMRTHGGQEVWVEKICKDPRYNPSNYDYDVAVLLLSSSFTLGHDVQYINLAQPGSRPAVGSVCHVTGWGMLSQDGYWADQLHVVEVPIVSEADCKAVYGQNAITDRMQCAGSTQGGKGACYVSGFESVTLKSQMWTKLVSIDQKYN